MKLIPYIELRPKKGIPWSRKHIRELVKAGKFPAPVRPGEQTVAWVESEVDSWLEARIAERDSTAA
jgi:prophage regulatory protein